MNADKKTFSYLCSSVFIGGLLLTSIAAAAPTGLDALNDEKLLNELASRDQEFLLNRAFEQARTPLAIQKAIRGRMTLLRLRDRPQTDLLETRKLVATYVDALPQVLPGMNDPAALIGDANLLIDFGIGPDQTVLEYFGQTPGAMARLRPVAQAVRQILEKAAQTAEAAANAAMENWPAQEKAWEVADEQRTIAQYTRAIVAYSAALSTDKADASREPMIADALNTLAGYDVDDNPDRASVKFYSAKLNLARGTPASLKAAAEGFQFALAKGRRDDIRQQFDARLLLASVHLQQKQPVDGDISGLQQWARAAGLDAQQVDVALAGVQYRQAVAANNADAADDILNTLQQNNPALRGLILELISVRLNNDTPVRQLKPLGLAARVAKAETETLKPAGRPFDSAAIERGVEAAREILRLRPTGAAVDDTGYVLGYFLQKIAKPDEAAAAFLDYIDANKDTGKPERLNNALDQAVAIVGDRMRQTPDNPTVSRLYDRTLATAVAPPLSRATFAYEYGRRLQAAGKADAAVAAFRAVPADDRNFNESRYYLMLAERQKLDKLPATDAGRADVLKDVMSLADTVNAGITQRLSQNPTPLDRTRLAQTRLLLADIALRDQKDPARAAKALDDFETLAKGLANEADLLGEALLLRVQAFVQLGDVNRATDQLVVLAKQNPNGAGQVVYNLLEKLNTQVTDAEAAGRTDEVARLERNRSLLTPFLVTWAEKHPDERIRKLAYTYRVFDADTQRRAAETNKDPAERMRLLAAAKQRFEALDSPDGRQAYFENLPKEKRSKAQYDPQAKLGLARVLLAEQDYEAARLQLAQLFADRVLGEGFITVPDAAGNFERRENPSYWEALLGLVRSNVALGQNLEAMKNLLAEQSLLYGDDLGGKRWHGAFVELTKQLSATPAANTGPAVASPATEPR